MRAALGGDVETVCNLVRDGGADPNAIGANGFSALIVAANNGHVGVADALLDMGASIDKCGRGGISALHACAGQGHAAMVAALCARGASVNIVTDTSGMTPLMLAARADHGAAMEALLASGAAVDRLGKIGYTALHVSALHGCLLAIGVLLRGGAGVAVRGDDGYTPLHLASLHGQDQAATMLLKHGAEVEARSKEGHSPLHVACASGHTELAQLLLAVGASPHAVSHFGQTPLHKAAQAGSQPLCQLLLRWGASAEAAMPSGETPLHCALRDAGRECVELFELMLGTGPSLLERNTPLWASLLTEAAWCGSVGALALLLPPPPSDFAEDTPATTTALSEAMSEAMSEALAEALTVATDRGRQEVVAFLKSRGAVLTTDRGVDSNVPTDARGNAPGNVDGGVESDFDRHDSAGGIGADSGTPGGRGVTVDVSQRPATSIKVSGDAPPDLASSRWAAKLDGMPPLSRRLLAANAAPSRVCPKALLREVLSNAPYSQYRASRAALQGGEAATVLRVTAALDGAACTKLRQALDEDGTSTTDSVDGMTEHVLYLSQTELEAHIGVDATRRLLAIPERFEKARELARENTAAAKDDSSAISPPHCSSSSTVAAPTVAPPHSAAATTGDGGCYQLFDCFLRRYSVVTAGDQLLTSFHADAAALTVNVALTSDDCVSGGRLLCVFDNAVRTIARAEGDATAHSSNLLHGVSRMHSGTRYSMIMFFH